MSVATLEAVSKGLPRRLSVRKFDVSYDRKAMGLSERIAVYLDGVELHEVAAWDVDEGKILWIARHSNGVPILDQQGLPAYEELKGKVEVRWANGAAA